MMLKIINKVFVDKRDEGGREGGERLIARSGARAAGANGLTIFQSINSLKPNIQEVQNVFFKDKELQF